MQQEWPYSSQISYPVFISHILTIYSLPPVALYIYLFTNIFPSWETTKEYTSSLFFGFFEVSS